MRNIGLVVSYDGTNYSGFQSQSFRNTIQDKLQEAIGKLTGETIKVTGSGRTDAGVHARGQVVNFHTASRIPIERWQLALNSRLPDDIVIRQAVELPETFHARKGAVSKTYRYTIHNSRVPDVFRRRYQLFHHAPLNVERMAEGLRHLIGEHDFTSFCSRKTEKQSYVRTLFDARIESESPGAADAVAGRDADGRCGVIHIYVTGSGFLYNMVRIIVGTLIEVGEGKRTPDDMLRILQARDRLAAGPTAPAHGLCLWEVVYPDWPVPPVY
jgi:tRNA pseudouridine38-40 synthase